MQIALAPPVLFPRAVYLKERPDAIHHDESGAEIGGCGTQLKGVGIRRCHQLAFGVS